MNQEKQYKNKDLFQGKEDFENAITNDFIGDDFVEQLEWAMLMVQQNFKQMRFADYLPTVTANHFDKAFLLSSNLNNNIKYFKPFTDLQATPDIFPLINLKYMTIDDTISLIKIKEMDLLSKRNLRIKKKYAFEYSSAFYKKDTECFYAQKNGYAVGDGFFKMVKDDKVNIQNLPHPISLNPNYFVPDDAIKYLSTDEIIDVINKISMAYQVAMSMFYEWNIYIKEYDNIGFTIPIEPSILSEIYQTSMLKFDDKKRMLHFVKEHYRRKVANTNEDYTVFVNRYLRGEHKFEYRGFYAEIIPPKYDLNRVRTRKKFIDATS